MGEENLEPLKDWHSRRCPNVDIFSDDAYFLLLSDYVRMLKSKGAIEG